MGVKKSELEQFWDDKDGPPSRKVTAVIVGCGQRGQNYAAFALDFPSRMEVVGVAEPVSHRRKMMEKLYNIPGDRCVKDWRELTQGDKLADAVIICTQDKDHKVVTERRSLMKYLYSSQGACSQFCKAWIPRLGGETHVCIRGGLQGNYRNL